jgi:hypothetical protein
MRYTNYAIPPNASGERHGISPLVLRATGDLMVRRSLKSTGGLMPRRSPLGQATLPLGQG